MTAAPCTYFLSIVLFDSRQKHTSYKKIYLNEFVANVLRDNMGSKKISLQPQKRKNEVVFWF